tara:strand:- start:43867 stop:44574 length:708 start_codon:yes stop_codon:yes gene_type:complete
MISNKNKLLLVEDDVSLGYLLSEYLTMKGFDVTWVKTGHEALMAIDSHIFHLAILDISMPDMDGFSLATKIKDQFTDLPFMFLTARSMKIDVLKGFSIGAVDYIKKPIDEEELVARIEALLLRIVPLKTKENTSVNYTIGNYTLDTLSQLLKHKKEIIKLTSRENQLLLMLVKNKNQLCSHKDILVSIWGKNDYFNRKSLNVFISHLRKYLSKDPALKIENVHRQGFILFIKEDK